MTQHPKNKPQTCVRCTRDCLHNAGSKWGWTCRGCIARALGIDLNPDREVLEMNHTDQRNIPIAHDLRKEFK